MDFVTPDTIMQGGAAVAVIAVVILFLRFLEKERDARNKEREREREDRKCERESFVATIRESSDRNNEAAKLLSDSINLLGLKVEKCPYRGKGTE